MSHLLKNGLDKGTSDGDGENFVIVNFFENEMKSSFGANERIPDRYFYHES